MSDPTTQDIIDAAASVPLDQRINDFLDGKLKPMEEAMKIIADKDERIIMLKEQLTNMKASRDEWERECKRDLAERDEALGKEAQALARVRELEAEVAAMRSVVEKANCWSESGTTVTRIDLRCAVDAYRELTDRDSHLRKDTEPA